MQPMMLRMLSSQRQEQSVQLRSVAQLQLAESLERIGRQAASRQRMLESTSKASTWLAALEGVEALLELVEQERLPLRAEQEEEIDVKLRVSKVADSNACLREPS
jgi:hypothetical protein